MDRGCCGGRRVAGSHPVVWQRGYFPGYLAAFGHFLSITDPATKVSRLGWPLPTLLPSRRIGAWGTIQILSGLI